MKPSVNGIKPSGAAAPRVVGVWFVLHTHLERRRPPMTQAELSRRAGISKVTVNAIATNRTKQVSLHTLARLADTLEIEASDLITTIRE
jgi:DNA-binding Xre family transcriptional regulator